MIDATHGNLEIWLACLTAGSAILYLRGVAGLWRKAGIGRGIRRREVVLFLLGSLALAAALLPPLDELTGRSFAMHMIQHEMLMVLAAPLLVLARPLEAWAWALPNAARRAFAVLARPGLLRDAWRRLTEPVGAWCFHALALWVWHFPALFRAALADERLHVLQHACFFASALAFWWSVSASGSRTRHPLAVASVFTTMLHTGALGALLTFAPSPWYVQSADVRLFGLTALEDQQLGGLVMWVPGSLAYLVAGLAIVGAWLAPSRAHHGAR